MSIQPIRIGHRYSGRCNVTSQVLSYLHGYTNNFQLRGFISFNSTVSSVIHTGSTNQWEVTYSTQTDTETVTSKKLFNAVAVCTGHHWHPKMPEISGIQGFTGMISEAEN